MLEDLDRIEVITAPAPPQWGANAVNGVDQRHDEERKDTQGSLL